MKKLSYDKMSHEVHTHKPAKPLASKLKNAALLTAGIFTGMISFASCGGANKPIRVASLTDTAYVKHEIAGPLYAGLDPLPVSNKNEKVQRVAKAEQTTNKTSVSDQSEKKIEKVAVSFLKNLWNKNNKEGLFTTVADYDPTSILNNNKFCIGIAFSEEALKTLKLKNGVTIHGFILIENKNDKKEGSFSIFANKDGVLIGSWFIEFNKLAEVYKEKTGKELKYTIAVVDHGVHPELGEYVDFYIIPAASFNDVKKGNIEPDMPYHIITYTAKDNTLWSNDDSPENHRTSADETIAKK